MSLIINKLKITICFFFFSFLTFVCIFGNNRLVCLRMTADTRRLLFLLGFTVTVSANETIHNTLHCYRTHRGFFLFSPPVFVQRKEENQTNKSANLVNKCVNPGGSAAAVTRCLCGVSFFLFFWLLSPCGVSACAWSQFKPASHDGNPTENTAAAWFEHSLPIMQRSRVHCLNPLMTRWRWLTSRLGLTGLFCPLRNR